MSFENIRLLKKDNSSSVESGFKQQPAQSYSVLRIDPYLNTKELKTRMRLETLYKDKNVDEFFQVLNKDKRILYGRKSSDDLSLYENILRTDNKDHAAIMSKIREKLNLEDDTEILNAVNYEGKLPIDYIIESRSNVNFLCFLVDDFDNPKRFVSYDFNNYFLNLKNDQYIERTKPFVMIETVVTAIKVVTTKMVTMVEKVVPNEKVVTIVKHNLFDKLYSIIENEEQYQEFCILIIEQLLKERKNLIQDFVVETSIDKVFEMKDIHYSTQILKLLSLYWNIGNNQDNFQYYKDKLTERSPFCELILDLKVGTGISFEVLFDRYLDKMKIEYKGYPNSHQIMLQKDINYLLDDEIFSNQYKTFDNKYHFQRVTPNFENLLDLHDEFMFITLSTKEQKIQKQIMNSSEPKQFDKILKKLDYNEIEKLLFARSPESYENILEQMLRKPINIVNHLITKICSTFGMDTFYTKRMLMMRNPTGKQLIDYVFESEDDDNLIRFLKSNFNTFNNPSLLGFINEQRKDKTDKTTILETMYDIINFDSFNLKTDCMLVLEKLLFDMVENEDIESDCDIETVLKMNCSKKVTLGLLIFYWKINSFNYDKYKKILILEDMFYDLMFMLKEGNEENFLLKYPMYLRDICYVKKSFLCIGNLIDSDILLSLALKNGLKQVMESIIKCQMIHVDKIRIPTDKSLATYENINFLMKLLLKDGYSFQEFNVPWVNVELFKDTLDAQIIEKYNNNITIEYNSNYDNINNKSLFSKESILYTSGMRDNMAHPVLSILINLKALYFQKYKTLNCRIFIGTFMIPFYFILWFHNEIQSWWFWCIYAVCIIGTFYLIVREFFQLRYRTVKKSFPTKISELKPYFNKRSNQIEIVLIVLSVLILVFIMIPDGMLLKEDVLQWSSAFLILLAPVELLTLLPYTSITIYMLMFKNVAQTFWKFLSIFFLVIFAFAFNFCIVIKPSAIINEQILKNKTLDSTKLELDTIISNSLNKSNDEDNVAHNFDNIFTSIIKTLLMLSGEFAIEPFQLENKLQIFLFFCFVLMSFILFNLIIGLVVRDVNQDKEQAVLLLLQKQMEYSIQTFNFVVALNHSFVFFKRNKYLKFYYSLIASRLHLSKQDLCLYNINYVSINIATGDVFIMDHANKNQTRKILKTNPLYFSKPYKLDKETVEKLIDIVNKNKIKLYTESA